MLGFIACAALAVTALRTWTWPRGGGLGQALTAWTWGGRRIDAPRPRDLMPDFALDAADRCRMWWRNRHRCDVRMGGFLQCQRRRHDDDHHRAGPFRWRGTGGGPMRL